MSRKYILVDRQPVEATLEQWGRWFETADRKVDVTELPSKVRVSTVFLGLDHNFSEIGPPLIFETMIFGGPHADYCDRCSTWEEAVVMHRTACAVARTGLAQIVKP